MISSGFVTWIAAMKVYCPDCGKVIPGENIALESGWAKCCRCQEVFNLSDVVPGYTPRASEGTAGRLLPERPFDAWAVLERTDATLMIHLPAQGMRAAICGMLAFATFWLAFVAFWTASALGLFGGKLELANLLFASFSTPFWLVGFGMLGAVLWAARGTRTVYIDASVMQTRLSCLFWRRQKTIDRAAVQHARQGVKQFESDDGNSTYFPCSAEIIYDKGSFRLPCTSEPERAWLLAQINDFLQAVSYLPSPHTESREHVEWLPPRE
jgi:hypothetical protein